jgi:hypothetical protein
MMAITNLREMILLQNLGFLTRDKHRLLDIGPQNVYGLTAEQLDTFVRNQGLEASPEHYQSEKQRLIYFSTERPNERTTLFSEIANLTNIEYNSFDVCPALKTEIFDLNFETLPDKYKEFYDVVLNFGTTEHVFNQWNSFEVIHDATRVGGVIYHELPASGYLDHGYYCYTPLFFQDLAKANNYEICQMFLTPAGENNVAAMGLEMKQRDGRVYAPDSFRLAPDQSRVPCFDIHVILKKTGSAEFHANLEIGTTHSLPDPGIVELYRMRYAPQLRPNDYEKRIMEIVRCHANEIAALKAKYEERITGTVQSCEERIAETVQSYDERIAETVQNYEGKISAVVAEREQTVATFEDTVSWRITAPLRAVRGLVRDRLFHRPLKYDPPQ